MTNFLNYKKAFITLGLIVVFSASIGQYFDSMVINSNFIERQVELINSDKAIRTDSIWSIFKSWNKFPNIQQKNKDYLFVYTDTFFGEIPCRVFIPKMYRSDVPATLVLMLHGAVGSSRFENAYKKDTTTGEDIFFDYF
jgi:hypothetical protein